MFQDRYGLPVSTTSTAALEAYVEGVDRFLSANAGADLSFERAIALDPGLAVAHIGRARSLQLQARMPEARDAAKRARSLVNGLTRREQDHVEALGLAVDGDAARALPAIRAHLADFPRDAMVLSPATGVYGLIGFSGRQDRNELLVELLDGLAAAYGDDWWFLSAHGFALTEAKGWKVGGPLIERALMLSPRNAHAAHAHAHVLYEGGDNKTGATFVEGWLPSYPRAAQLHCHLSWHLALFHLGLGRPERAKELYASSIRPDVSLSPPMGTLCDSASLLWRSELAGEKRSVADWQDVGAHAERFFPRIGLAFADAHCALAFAVAGNVDAFERCVAEMRRVDAEGRLAAGHVLPVVAEAFVAFARGEWESVIRLLAPEVERFVRIGGSHAQRDLFENTRLAAYMRAGRSADATALLERRLDRQPSVPIARGL